jgi:hypothetical protein
MFLSRLNSARSPSKIAFSRFAGSAASIRNGTATPMLRTTNVGLKALAGQSSSLHSRSFSAAPKVVAQDMFCRQCEQTKDHYACTSLGVCGKTSETAACQDTLMEMIKSVSTWADAARKAGVSPDKLREANVWTLSATFSTLTNVNFSDERIGDYIWQGQAIQKDLRKKLANAGGAAPTDPIADLDLSGLAVPELEEFGHTVRYVQLK